MICVKNSELCRIEANGANKKKRKRKRKRKRKAFRGRNRSHNKCWKIFGRSMNDIFFSLTLKAKKMKEKKIGFTTHMKKGH